MKMEYSMKLTQEQKLHMTQEMQLSIKMLQMSVTDLREYIDKEFAENPILDMSDNNQEKSSISEDKFMDKYNYKEMIKYFEFDNYGAQSKGIYEDEVSPFNFISEKKSLKEYLYEQLIELNIDKYTRVICNYIIDNLDHRGYLECDLEIICKELKISKELGEKALLIVQDLEPYGIGARDIKECLLIQLDKLALDDEKMITIVNNHLEDIANNKYALIGKSLNISPREAQRYGDVIKKLEPKPSSGFYTGEEVKFIIPDAAIREIDDQLIIIMNDSILPRLSINSGYKKVINEEGDKNATEYVKDKLNKAMFLIKSIEQRRSTLYNVLEEIIKRQEEYFKKGYNYLKPMTLKEISEVLNIHESTVSRAIKDKYILTDRGTVKIKDLFTTAIKNSEDLGVVKIKNRIKEIIEGENKKKPFSDQYISDKLIEENMEIKRRTVAKYREELGIKSSSKRKRL
ncbi:RNA polymerase factor sigma-54 [Clostridium thermobutyricum]|uniref:RNA polymerase factor sigma-54 n=1 Tax=Clostridium thermobutyricum TaxID=29372 RepID=UPI003F51F4D2